MITSNDSVFNQIKYPTSYSQTRLDSRSSIPCQPRDIHVHVLRSTDQEFWPCMVCVMLGGVKWLSVRQSSKQRRHRTSRM